jgi:hypothetical protein
MSKKASKDTKRVVLNLSEGMNERIVKNSQDKIHQLEASIERMMPVFMEKKEFYDLAFKEFNDVKVQMENLEGEINKEEIIIATFKTYGKGEVVRQVQEEQRSGTRAPKRIAWLDEASDVLAQADRFLEPLEIFESIMAKPHIQDSLKQMKSGSNVTSVRMTTLDSLISHGKKAMSGKYTNIFKPRVTWYQERLGLPEWTDENSVPKARYIKEFMYDKK